MTHRVAPGATRGTNPRRDPRFQIESLIPASLKRNSYVYKKKRKRTKEDSEGAWRPPSSLLDPGLDATRPCGGKEGGTCGGEREIVN